MCDSKLCIRVRLAIGELELGLIAIRLELILDFSLSLTFDITDFRLALDRVDMLDTGDGLVVVLRKDRLSVAVVELDVILTYRHVTVC